MTEKLIEYSHDETVLEGLLVLPEARGPRPGVLVAHAWGGRGEVEEATARRLAGMGYVGFAIDMFGKGVRGSSREENAGLIAPFLEDRSMLQNRILSSVNILKEQSEVDSSQIAAVGFCFGGLCVLDLARSGVDVRGVVSFHGLFNPPEPHPSQPIRARVLALHGHEDPMVPVEAVNALKSELTEAGADWQLHVYGGVMHAFTNPKAADPDFGTVYDQQAERRAWQSASSFLAEIFA